jgi:hypothetical protein
MNMVIPSLYAQRTETMNWKNGAPAPYLEKYCGACKDRFKQEIYETISRWIVSEKFERSELNKWLAEIAEE